MDTTKVIERAIDIAGSEAKLGKGTGFSQVAINKAKHLGRVTPRMALEIHRFLGGAVSAAELRPDIWATPDDASRAAAKTAEEEV